MIEIETIRHNLHRLAEFSGKEIKTLSYIASIIKEFKLTNIYEYVGGFGLLAEFNFDKNDDKKGKTILFRADMDAVAIEEKNDIEYKSVTKSIAHLCGHDGHMSILIQLAQLINENPFKAGTILLLFQPAEEIGKGAEAVIESKILDKYKIDYAFALHNIPGYDLGQILIRRGSFSCGVISCDINFSGKEAHAAQPEKSLSPFDLMISIKNKIKELQNDDFNSNDYFLATLIEFCVGEKKYGVSAGKGVLRATFRAKTNSILNSYCSMVENMVKEEVDIFNNKLYSNNCLDKKRGDISNTSFLPKITYNINYCERFYANENNDKAVDIIEKATKQLGMNYINLEQSFRWGEDFGFFTQKYPGAMFGVGSGENCSPLHCHTYNFPNQIILPTAKLLYRIAENLTTK